MIKDVARYGAERQRMRDYHPLICRVVCINVNFQYFLLLMQLLPFFHPRVAILPCRVSPILQNRVLTIMGLTQSDGFSP